jgi:hypothetical protein
MAKRHPVRNSQFMKALRDVHSFFQEESLKIRNNQQVLPHTAKWSGFVVPALKLALWRMNTGGMLKIDSSNFFSGDEFNYVTN